ncbi:hypothetical protein ACWF94_19395 [Streptomyces sp. NPDC055078]
MTRDALTSEPPAESGATCCVCKRWTPVPMPVRHIERASGPPVTLYACPQHVVGLTPAPVPGELDPDT